MESESERSRECNGSRGGSKPGRRIRNAVASPKQTGGTMNGRRVMLTNSIRRAFSVARKELLHIFRDPMTLFFTLVLPVADLFLLGYAVDTNVRHIKTVILDQAGTQESRSLLQRFENSENFDIVARVFSDEDLHQSIVSGKAKVGIKIPSDYSERQEAGQTGQLLILVDGGESSIA